MVGPLVCSWLLLSGMQQLVDAQSGQALPFELLVGGTRPLDYMLNVFRPQFDPTYRSYMSAQIMAKTSATKGPMDYAALFYRVDASLIRGHRVMLQAVVTPTNVEDGAWAGLFVRLQAVDGRVLAFDNMTDRPIMGSYPGNRTEAEVVLQVPGVDEDENACADPNALAATMVVGVFLCGGRGIVQFNGAELKRVGPEYPLTTGSSAWSNPALDDLGPGTPWRPGQARSLLRRRRSSSQVK